MERSFLILGTGAEDFWQGYETFSHCFAGMRKCIKSNFLGYETILLDKVLDENIDQRKKENLRDTWK